jgi:tripartite-type tricarboxylate transporter receptor subunit TctC
VKGKIFGTVLAAGLAAWIGAAQAQNFPVRPVTLIVPWPAGGTTDVGMRALATATEKHLGQSIVIENRPGGSGSPRARWPRPQSPMVTRSHRFRSPSSAFPL